MCRTCVRKGAAPPRHAGVGAVEAQAGTACRRGGRRFTMAAGQLVSRRTGGAGGAAGTAPHAGCARVRGRRAPGGMLRGVPAGLRQRGLADRSGNVSLGLSVRAPAAQRRAVGADPDDEARDRHAPCRALRKRGCPQRRKRGGRASVCCAAAACDSRARGAARASRPR